MRIWFAIEGGLAFITGLSEPVTIDTASLSATDASELNRMIERARLSERPSIPDAAEQQTADLRHYTITVDDGVRRQSVRLMDPIQDPDLAALVNALTRIARNQSR